MSDLTGMLFAPLAFVIGLMVGSSCGANHLAQIRACEAACVTNDGLALSYRDGSCECLNGAMFDEPEAKK